MSPTCLYRSTWGSAELNPLTRGSHAKCKKIPCWPWLYGTHLRPKGALCRLCMITFTLGGFNTQYLNPEALHTATEQNASLLEEFLACGSEDLSPHMLGCCMTVGWYCMIHTVWFDMAWCLRRTVSHIVMELLSARGVVPMMTMMTNSHECFDDQLTTQHLLESVGPWLYYMNYISYIYHIVHTYIRHRQRICPLLMVAHSNHRHITDQGWCECAMWDAAYRRSLAKACSKQLIALINAGKINMRLKGNKKKQIMKSMLEERKKTAQLVMQEGIRVKSKFKAIAFDTYVKDNPDFNPAGDGALVRMLNLPGQLICNTVVIMHLCGSETLSPTTMYYSRRQRCNPAQLDCVIHRCHYWLYYGPWPPFASLL